MFVCRGMRVCMFVCKGMHIGVHYVHVCVHAYVGCACVVYVGYMSEVFMCACECA